MMRGDSGVIRPAPRRRGEKAWIRFLKNLGFGAASRCGIEISLFFEDERMIQDDGDGILNDDDE